MAEPHRMSEIEMADETAMLRILKIIRHAQDFANTAELYDRIVNAICEVYKRYYHVSIFLADPKENVLRLSAIAGEGAQDQKRLFPSGYAHSFNTGITGEVYSTGRMYLSNDVSKDPLFVDVMSPRTRSELCLPIKDGHVTIGALNIESDHIGSFAATDVYLFEILTTVLGNAIQRDRLQGELRDTLGALTALASAEPEALCILDDSGVVAFGNLRFLPLGRLKGLREALSPLAGGGSLDGTFLDRSGSPVHVSGQVISRRGGYVVVRLRTHD